MIGGTVASQQEGSSFKDMQVNRLTDDSKIARRCKCDYEWVTCPGCILPLAQCQLGVPPATQINIRDYRKWMDS